MYILCCAGDKIKTKLFQFFYIIQAHMQKILCFVFVVFDRQETPEYSDQNKDFFNALSTQMGIFKKVTFSVKFGFLSTHKWRFRLP